MAQINHTFLAQVARKVSAVRLEVSTWTTARLSQCRSIILLDHALAQTFKATTTFPIELYVSFCNKKEWEGHIPYLQR